MWCGRWGLERWGDATGEGGKPGGKGSILISKHNFFKTSAVAVLRQAPWSGDALTGLVCIFGWSDGE